MSTRPFLAFVCAHMTDERLYAAQVSALQNHYECRVFVFRNHDSLGAMAGELLAGTPSRFTLIGLSLGGYVSFEVIRRQLDRIERLVLLDTTAVADDPARRAGRLADMKLVSEQGLDALIAQLPARWFAASHAQRPELRALVAQMAHAIGADGQRNQQTAMMARPDSHADLRRVRVPTLIACGRDDVPTPVRDHEGMAACVPGSRLAIIEDCGHLSAIEQPEALTRILAEWLRETDGERGITA
jgi:pimeloyl-ACP methyl ester carboxylesterase